MMKKRILSLIMELMLLVPGLSTLAEPAPDAPELPGLVWESRMNLVYATGFSVDYYEGGYALIDVKDSAQYLVVPEGMPVPEGLNPGIRVLQQPLDRIYLAATSAMALFDRLDALSSIRLVGTAASGWYIDNAVAAIERGDMLFSGKYSEPDYELMINEGCDLAIESTMILHSPKVQEMIELLGIPVFIDRSSYENHPLGRTEWIKLYSVLVDKEAEAEAFFATQTAIIDDEVIDSLDLTGLIADIEDTFDIEIGMNDIVPENFNTVDAMWAMIQRLQG